MSIAPKRMPFIKRSVSGVIVFDKELRKFFGLVVETLGVFTRHMRMPKIVLSFTFSVPLVEVAALSAFTREGHLASV